MNKNNQGASLVRRLLAIFYDLLLLTAVLLVVASIPVTLNGGKAFLHPLVSVVYVLVAYLFFAWFWMHGGQTLGMRAWKLKVLNDNGANLDWKQSAIRFAAAGLSLIPVGLGYLWILFDSNNLSWHDKLSKSRIVDTRKLTEN